MNPENDPLTATGNLRAVIKRVGTIEFAIAVLRAYWKPIGVFVMALIAGITFVLKVNALISAQATQTAVQLKLVSDVATLSGKVDEISKSQTELAKSQLQTSTALQSLFDAAKIEVRPEPKTVAKRR